MERRREAGARSIHFVRADGLPLTSGPHTRLAVIFSLGAPASSRPRRSLG